MVAASVQPLKPSSQHSGLQCIAFISNPHFSILWDFLPFFYFSRETLQFWMHSPDLKLCQTKFPPHYADSSLYKYPSHNLCIKLHFVNIHFPRKIGADEEFQECPEVAMFFLSFVSFHDFINIWMIYKQAVFAWYRGVSRKTKTLSA